MMEKGLDEASADKIGGYVKLNGKCLYNYKCRSAVKLPNKAVSNLHVL